MVDRRHSEDDARIVASNVRKQVMVLSDQIQEAR